jgi:malonate-semialdehyde dehydrogenase (acetylating)/methylmalonate-semialdehyde dehydrogenase
LAELMMEAGAPPGVLQVVNGDKEAVDAIIEDPGIQAVSFVGSSAIAEYVYAQGAAQGKRVQAMGGAKNHAIVLPDADLDSVANELMGAGYGSAGERCMAISVVVPVTERIAESLVHRLKRRVEGMKIGLPSDPEAAYGPLITAQHRKKVLDYIALGEQEGADLVVDGRGFSLQGYENGFFLGPSLFDRVTPDMKTYQEEIFGPVLQVARARDFDEALALPSRHQYGNGVAIFTRDGDTAREFASRVNVGMVGINVPIPVPLAYYSFGGWKRSAFGDANQHGADGVRFFTQVKTVTARWPKGARGSSFVMPTMR